MAFLAPAFAAIGGVLGSSAVIGAATLGTVGLLGAQLLKGGPKQGAVQAPVSRDSAIVQQAADDALARRKGAAADILTGTSGAEATPGMTGRLVVGS